MFRDVVRREAPNLVFVMETKAHVQKMEFLKCSMGLVLFWGKYIHLEILSYSKISFDAWLYDEPIQSKRLMTTGYWHLDVEH